MTNSSSLQVEVQIEMEGADEEEIDRQARLLRGEILEGLEVDSAELVRAGDAPEGTKVVDPVILGVLLVAVGPTVLTKFLEFLHAWAMRREGRTVKIKLQTPEGAVLEVEAPQTMSPAEVKNWIDTLSQAASKKKSKG